jgi:hypothetical protein
VPADELRGWGLEEKEWRDEVGGERQWRRGGVQEWRRSVFGPRGKCTTGPWVHGACLGLGRLT